MSKKKSEVSPYNAWHKSEDALNEIVHLLREAELLKRTIDHATGARGELIMQLNKHGIKDTKELEKRIRGIETTINDSLAEINYKIEEFYKRWKRRVSEDD